MTDWNLQCWMLCSAQALIRVPFRDRRCAFHSVLWLQSEHEHHGCHLPGHCLTPQHSTSAPDQGPFIHQKKGVSTTTLLATNKWGFSLQQQVLRCPHHSAFLGNLCAPSHWTEWLGTAAHDVREEAEGNGLGSLGKRPGWGRWMAVVFYLFNRTHGSGWWRRKTHSCNKRKFHLGMRRKVFTTA